MFCDYASDISVIVCPAMSCQVSLSMILPSQAPRNRKYTMGMRVGELWDHDEVGTSTQLASQVPIQLHHTSI